MRGLLTLLAVLVVCPAWAQSITFTADIVQANGNATPTLVWDTTPLASNCAASGAWSGQKGGSGSETIPTLSASATFNLTCTWSGSIGLSWTPPTQNTDGTPLTDLTAYRFYWGPVSSSYPDQLRVDNPGMTTFVIDSLPAGTYFLVATAINSLDVESDVSNEVSKTVIAGDISESIAVTINPQPNPILDLTVF